MLANGEIRLNIRQLIAGVVCIVVAVFAVVVVHAQQKSPAKIPGLTVEDRLEIQELLHRYMFVLDSCSDHNNGYDYADLYTDDGQFGDGPKGRAALAAAAGRASDGKCSPIRLRGAMNQIHINVGEMIEPSPEGARGISYLMMIDGPANEIYWNGWYQDIYVKTPKGWRFKSRKHFNGDRVGVPVDLSVARDLWEHQPVPAGSRSLVGKGERPAHPSTLAGDPLKWFDDGANQ